MKYILLVLLLSGCSQKHKRPIVISVDKSGNYVLTIPDELNTSDSFGEHTSTCGYNDTANHQWIYTLKKNN